MLKLRYGMHISPSSSNAVPSSLKYAIPLRCLNRFHADCLLIQQLCRGQHSLLSSMAARHYKISGARLAQAADAARSERKDLEQEDEQQQLEEKKQQRLQQLKGSTPEAMQIMREAMGDSAGQFMVASHGQVRLCK